MSYQSSAGSSSGAVALATSRVDPSVTDVAAGGLVFVLSGPSGVGKSTIVELLKRDGFPITYCVTATTRPRRPNEVDGEHYHFLTEAQFQALVERGELFEHAIVHGVHHYGIPAFAVREGLKQGHDLIMTPEVQGAATVRAKLPEAITIFLRPTSLEDLIPRLEARGSETAEERRRRLQTAKRELECVSDYEYQVVNAPGGLQDAVDTVKAIISAERARVRKRLVTFP